MFRLGAAGVCVIGILRIAIAALQGTLATRTWEVAAVVTAVCVAPLLLMTRPRLECFTDHLRIVGMLRTRDVPLEEVMTVERDAHARVMCVKTRRESIQVPLSPMGVSDARLDEEIREVQQTVADLKRGAGPAAA